MLLYDSKYKVFFTVFMVLMTIQSCNSRNDVPDDLMTFTEMTDALEMIYINEVKAIGMYELRTQKDAYMKLHLYPAIFDSLGISDSTFYRSYDYYESNPLVLEAILDSVIASIETLEADTAAGNNIQDLNEAYKEIRQVERDRKRREQEKIE